MVIQHVTQTWVPFPAPHIQTNTIVRHVLCRSEEPTMPTLKTETKITKEGNDCLVNELSNTVSVKLEVQSIL